jgi:hypothetical protein
MKASSIMLLTFLLTKLNLVEASPLSNTVGRSTGDLSTCVRSPFDTSADEALKVAKREGRNRVVADGR